MYIELKNVSKKIKGIDILDDVSLRMESGKIYGFREKNGSGKTMSHACNSRSYQGYRNS
ncbi:MAG: hypothetical protein ACLR7D_11120 [Lachnospira eligens]